MRARKKAQTRLQPHALRLFLARGYDATTVDELAAAAGVSHMTFFRHFPTKESVVDTDDYDPMIAALIAGRPPAEDPLTAIQQALLEGFATALITWVDNDGSEDLPELVDLAFAALRRGLG